MNFPATIYVQDIGSQLRAMTVPDGALRHPDNSVADLVGQYALQRVVTISLGPTTVVDAVPPTADPLPAQLFVQMSNNGGLFLNRTAQGAARNLRLGDGTVGVYIRSKYVSVQPSTTLTDVVPVVAAAPVIQQT